MPSNFVNMRGSDLPLREPTERCEACGTTGSVGRILRLESEVLLELHRFCASCWPEEKARYEARWREQRRLVTDEWMRSMGRQPPPPSTGVTIESATWHATLDLVEELRRLTRGPATRAELAAVAADIRASAADREGLMPLAVEMFLDEFGSSPAASEGE